MQVVGICVHFALLVVLFYNLFKHVLKLNQKPFSIVIFYTAAFITLVALIICFAIIGNPKTIVAEFSALFVAEWGIQIVGAS